MIAIACLLVALSSALTCASLYCSYRAHGYLWNPPR